MIEPFLAEIEPGQVAFVHDALAFVGGAERTLSAMLELFPGAPVYTLVHNPIALQDSIIARHPIIPSSLNHLPRIHRHYRSFLPLFPSLVEQFDLSSYPVVISSSYAAAHGVLTGAGQLHLAYLYTPMRHAWHGNEAYIRRISAKSVLAAWIARRMLHNFRLWDILAAQRPDQILAASELVAARVQRYYRRPAQVLYPPVEVERFRPGDNGSSRRDYYLVVSRLRPHKQVSLIIEAFNRLGFSLLVVGEGSEERQLRRAARPNIHFLGWQTDDRLRGLFSGAKALVHAAEEDFGLTLVEAQAAGCPVIAYGRGGAAETILPDITGILFPEQTAESLIEAIRRFESNQSNFDPRLLRQNADLFSKFQFQEKFLRICTTRPVLVTNPKIDRVMAR